MRVEWEFNWNLTKVFLASHCVSAQYFFHYLINVVVNVVVNVFVVVVAVNKFDLFCVGVLFLNEFAVRRVWHIYLINFWQTTDKMLTDNLKATTTKREKQQTTSKHGPKQCWPRFEVRERERRQQLQLRKWRNTRRKAHDNNNRKCRKSVEKMQ